jgi:hypothetical protein
VPEIEINLKLPTLTVKTPNEPDKRIDNSEVRFIRRIDMPALPKPGQSLQLTAGEDRTVECTVTRSDWHEAKGLFVVSCNYAKRSVTPDLYGALVNDSGWTVKHLLD